jgi:HK97 family phage major capsid protein
VVLHVIRHNPSNKENNEMALSIATQMEIRAAQQEAEQISLKAAGTVTAQDKQRFNFLMSQISLLKTGALSDETRMASADALAEEFGFAKTDRTEVRTQQNHDLRGYLREGREARTYSGMSVATDNAGGFLVPAGYFRDRIFSSLKAADRLFDPSVVTFFESNDGNVLTVPMEDDTEVSAAIVSENAQSTEGEINTIDRLQLAKVPTWRSKQIIWSMELLQDSAFPAEDVIADAIAKRFQRGIGAANVTTLLSAATSGATSVSGTAVGINDLLNLMGSIDPSYLSSPKCFWAMRFSTLIGILQLKDSSGRNLVHPRTDANGNFLLLEKPVAICPSVPSVAVNSKSVLLGDFSRMFVRTVKSSLKLMKYSEAVGLAEAGLFAFEGFCRANSGLLVASGADSPIKFLTQASA